ncbi:lasso RiPP family leader peptide-containing protein [Egibacter rhizosphaerae]|uniref:Lasso RiPP family leader peptide-containing protein n=1 Tax=Egibacter rhizosphaerae TaxID=1670831 RepID=A0A411YG75_9ACTN|nr:lasso RiPP family leader peptide-containing protein [Egibacter rhizosphaerae]
MTGSDRQPRLRPVASSSGKDARDERVGGTCTCARSTSIEVAVKAYETPSITELGSVAAMTRGEGVKGDDDTLAWFIKYGTDPTS